MLHRMQGVGLPNVYLATGFKVERIRDEQTVSYLDLDGLYFRVAFAVASRPASLTGREFRFLRKRLGMSQEQAGRLVGKSDQAIAKWEKEKGSIPVSDGQLIRLAWLSKFARRELPRAVDRMVQTSEFMVGDYVFAFKDGKWIDDAAASVFAPMLAQVQAEISEVIARMKATAVAYTTLRTESEGMT